VSVGVGSRFRETAPFFLEPDSGDEFILLSRSMLYSVSSQYATRGPQGSPKTSDTIKLIIPNFPAHLLCQRLPALTHAAASPPPHPVCVCVCVCAYTHIRTHAHTHTHVRTHARTYTHTHSYRPIGADGIDKPAVN
jgi:hypothetical protein